MRGAVKRIGGPGALAAALAATALAGCSAALGPGSGPDPRRQALDEWRAEPPWTAWRDRSEWRGFTDTADPRTRIPAFLQSPAFRRVVEAHGLRGALVGEYRGVLGPPDGPGSIPDGMSRFVADCVDVPDGCTPRLHWWHGSLGVVEILRPPPRPAAGGSSGRPEAPIHAEVLAVDNNIHLIMLSAGADDGVKKGYCFTVYRGDKYIGKVEVERTFGDMSSARIINPLSAPAGIVREGDSASTGVY